jgi:hypothetical protein
MRNTTFISSMVLSVACVSAANAAIMIDNFTQSQAAITTWDYSGNGTSVEGINTFGGFGSTGTGILGNRLVCTNTWADNATTTASATMSGNGQLAVSLFGGDASDNQLMTQYKFSSAINMNTPGQTHIYIAGSGAGTSVDGSGFGIGIILFTGLAVDGGGTPIYDMRAYSQIDMNSSQSLGSFSFDALAVATENGFTAAEVAAINGFAVYQYVAGGSTWNYTATSFSIVPAPGAVALLGAAGLIGARRRRD